MIDLLKTGARSSLQFDFGTGPIYFDNVNCNGDEEFLFNCTAEQIGTHNCNHFEDAGVVCEGTEY